MESPTLSHEMGHCLGLYHTFAQLPVRIPSNNIFCCSTGPTGETVDGQNGCECGDYVQDTPPFYAPTRNGVSYPSCHFLTTDMDCNEHTYHPDEKNIMNYTYLPCREHFTAGQGARMRWVINQGGINPPDPAFPPSLDGILVTGIFEDLAITNQEIWDLSDFPSGFVTINQSLSVEPGASLSITSAIIVQFAANASLHVKPNGLLELDGNLTGLCGSPWQGVFVWGDCSKGQQPVNNIYAQGRFNGKKQWSNRKCPIRD